MAGLEAEPPFISLACPLLAEAQNCMVSGTLVRSCPQRPLSEEGDMVLPSDHHRAACPRAETPTGPSQMGEHLSHVFQSEETCLLLC